MVLSRIQEILADHLNLTAEEIKMESNITSDLGADSLDLVEMIMDFEEEFNVSIPDAEVEKIKTVGDLVNFIEANK